MKFNLIFISMQFVFLLTNETKIKSRLRVKKEGDDTAKENAAVDENSKEEYVRIDTKCFKSNPLPLVP